MQMQRQMRVAILMPSVKAAPVNVAPDTTIVMG